MEQLNDTLNQRKNKHLNAYERGQIKLLLDEGKSIYFIAKRLKRAYNTIRAELKRGSVTQIKCNKKVVIYYPDTGQTLYEQTRKNCGNKYRLLKCEAFIKYVEQKYFNQSFSLDAIVGSALRDGTFTRNQIVCSKTLYNYVDAGLLQITNIDLPLKLTRSTKYTRIRANKKHLGDSISKRPEAINKRLEFGHWEIDTVIGNKSKTDEVLLTMTERLTRKEIIRKIPGKTAQAVQQSMLKLIADAGPHFSKVFKSITADNGSEFSELATLEPITKIYFTHPYSSFERGTNERHNGLIRRFIPKGNSICNYSLKFIQKIQQWCNTLPRKILGYLSPNEAFDDELMKVIY